ncbi:MAG: Polyphosphate kinase 2, partial [Pseudomonadota bacterium]|nr:Polyphosphate kinase 2 [Pseudomonadota bacterium]
MAREKASVAAKPRVAKTSGAAAAPAKKTTSNAGKAVARPASKAAPAAPVRGRSKPRAAAAGDIGPISGQPKIEAHAVVEAVTAAQEARLAAMRDIISGRPRVRRQPCWPRCCAS